MARTDYGAILSTVIKDTSDAVREVNGTSSLIAPNQWGTAIRTMHSDSDYENALEQMIEETATGDIASFSDGANNIPCPSVLCTINPVQDLHGQDYPYPSGGGKNKLALTVDNIKLNNGGDSSWNGNSKTINNVTFTIQTNEVGAVVGIKATGTASSVTTLYLGATDLLSGTSYTINGCPSNGSSTTFSLMLLVGGSGSSALANDFGTGVSYTETSSQSRGLQIVIRSGYAIPTGGFTFYPMIRLSSVTDSTFAPYSNICPITGHTELNLVQKDGNNTVVHTYTTDLGTTVYGGTLDVVSGVLTIDRIIVNLGNLTWYKNSSYNEFRAGISRNSLPLPKEYASNVIGKWICSALKPETENNTYRGTVDYAISINISYISASNSSCEDDTAFTTAMNGVQFVYELATPTTTQLTPQEVKSLLGSNNIYHDCNGQVAVTYRANGQLYVEQH